MTAPRKYRIVYADPAWTYKNYAYEEAIRGCRKEYPTMSVDQICSLPITEIVAPDCALFLWAVWPLMPEAFRVIDAWGFTYKTLGFDWVKRNKSDCGFFFGMGNYTRSNSEPCLLAVKGKPERISAGVSQLIFQETIMEPLAAHSVKPLEVRDRIVQLLGDVPRVELFARTKTPGWDVWGNEVESDVQIVPRSEMEAKARTIGKWK